jgi:hypothetical protein
MITMTCLILWMPTGAFVGSRCVPAGAVSAKTAASATSDSATTNNDLRTIAF